MSETKFLKCSCAACGKPIEYPAEAAGESFACPHCGQQTLLTVEVPEISVPAARRWSLIWIIALLLLIGALGALAPTLLRRMLAKRRNSTANNP